MGLRQGLSQFDLTNIIVGAIVGADIYIASALTAGLVGPFSIVLWAVAGLFAIAIAMVFAYCSYYVPRVGGPFAYVSEAFDDFYGYLAGWSMWIAELLALPVFAIAFANYLQALVPLTPVAKVAVRALFVASLTLVNIVGVRAAGRLNDALTLIKLSPLLLLAVTGFGVFIVRPETFVGNYTPLLPLGLQNAAHALVLIFWAYAGFELGTLPAGEVENPQKAIPRAIVTGMLIVSFFYLSTNFVLFGVVNWTELDQSTVPLVVAGTALFGSAGALIMTVGALFSVAGSDESGMLGSARLAYAMAIDGLFPRAFAKIHPRYNTPYVVLIIQGAIAFVLSSIGNLPGLISFAVLNLAFSFLLTCFSLIVLRSDGAADLRGQHLLPLAGIAICLFLLFSTTTFDKVTGVLVILAGIPIYLYYSPKTDIRHLKDVFLSEEAVFLRRLEAKETYLANLLALTHTVFRRIRRRGSREPGAR
ncbi:MAG: amino acid permease [Methanoculleus sp.]|uniref:amino acid permease n=1 Tax=unclassified Methanoculleus TaxID=2619537 RepID=UPI0025F28AF3|nr:MULTISPECIES: amino acid permease [unclassified Methanoculleus]MCK9319186.1 APC family permease [Methanoculleus sp.]MDD2255105.1 amino acid permease [Methanoculleus sp.]MDD3217388.1 amino acid permease [Methanoculleus sp.]MDD4315458.1 amino acid permease [Methanoculleus sp.]MDD4471619.1 amino acid permease [Methanoculleus sp.]